MSSNCFASLAMQPLRKMLLERRCYCGGHPASPAASHNATSHNAVSCNVGAALAAQALPPWADWSSLKKQWLGLQQQRWRLQSSFNPRTPVAVCQQNTGVVGNITKQSFFSIDARWAQIETQEVDWLITVFNALFTPQQVVLVRGAGEPEYFPAKAAQAARIEFAHGFFASALHEISHWCIAGKQRRTLPDFGYWYVADGRNAVQQHQFEQFEVKPQAIECLFTLMCHKSFTPSQDNLNANYAIAPSDFEQNVLALAQTYCQAPQLLPADAQTLLTALAYLCHDTPL